ncbi:PIG-X [Lentinula edodes]|uniref:Protein PBN1 n=1 Tax=Lentinula lateritia TaxID=40482 RepID=A0A9W9DSE8_9AGAR|nr:PIG-X [Lentinula edodes]
MLLNVSSSIEPLHGFHRTITTSIASENDDWIQSLEESQCLVRLYYKLPVLVFVDPYELVNYQHLYTFHHHGNANLELPVAAMDSNGTSLLLTLTSVGPHVDVTVPIHLRYGEISHSNSEAHHTAEIAWPHLFLSCSSSVQIPNASLISYDLPPEEFASSLAGYSLYVTSESFRADPDAQFMTVAVPVGQLGDLAQVRLGTVLTIVVMFLYVAYISYTTARRLGKRVKLVKGE